MKWKTPGVKSKEDMENQSSTGTGNLTGSVELGRLLPTSVIMVLRFEQSHVDEGGTSIKRRAGIQFN